MRQILEPEKTFTPLHQREKAQMRLGVALRETAAEKLKQLLYIPEKKAEDSIRTCNFVKNAKWDNQRPSYLSSC